MKYEESLQIAYVEWLDIQAKLYPKKNLQFGFHCPNGEKRHIRTAMKLKRMGVRRGVPDIIFFSPGKIFLDSKPYVFRGLVIEFKSLKGKLSKEQKLWLEFFKNNDFLPFVTSNLEEAITLTSKYFKLI
jgi:hypothetical protein